MSPDSETRIFKSLEKIEGLLLGTYERPEGVVAKVAKHETWIQGQKCGREGLMNYAYKVAIMIVLTYLAVKTGLQ